MRIALGFLLTILVLVCNPVAAAPAPPAAAPDSIIVQFQPGASAAERSAAHAAVHGLVRKTIPGLDVSVVEVGVGSVEAALRIYTQNPNVVYAEPNFRRLLYRPTTNEGGEPSLGIDNNFDEQWGLHNTGQGFGATVDPIFGTLIHPSYQGTSGADINAPEGWGTDRHGSPSVAIAVLDSGVACTHVDLDGKCIEEQSFVSEHGSPLNDVIGHGTHVAGIAAANTDNFLGIAGVGWSSSIGSMKVCWEDMSLAILGIVIGQCDDADVAEAIDYVTSTGDYQVINMSLAGPEMSVTLQNAIDAAWAAGIVIVAGAGNEYSSNMMYPAGYDNVIAVGSSDQHDNLSSFSTFGTWVSVLAPGSTILSTVPGEFCGQAEGVPSECYDWKSGTSMATPHVAGLAALLWAHTAGATATDIRNIIETSADPVGVLQQNFGAWVQYGRINVAAALASNPGGGGSGGTDPSSHHVDALTVGTVNVGRGSKVGQAQVRVLDDLGQPVAGASVYGSFSGSFTEDASAVTDGAGNATLETSTSEKGGVTFSFCVTDVVSSTSYDAASNLSTCATF